MAFTSGNDENIIQSTDTSVVSAGAGNDKYILAANKLAAGQTITISDTEGTNTLQLIGGLTIKSSLVANNVAQLTLSNGAIVNINGADKFSYEVGGNPLVGTAGAVQTYTDFATKTLGAASVPAAGAAAVAGAADKVIDGSTSGGTSAGKAFTLTSATTADVPQLTTGNDTITGGAGTFNSNDVLADSSTTDSDTLNAVLSTSLTTAPTLSNIENINLDFKGFGLKFNAGSTSNGTITVSSTQEGNSTATLQNAGATAKVTVGSGVSTLNLESSGTTLNLTGGQSLTIDNGNGAGTLAFVSGGSSANTITYTTTTSKTLAVSGSQSLTIKTADVGQDFGGNTVSKTLSGTATLTLDLTAVGSAAADLSKVAADSFNISGSGSQSLGLSSGSNVTLTKDLAATAQLGVGTLAVDGANDSLNLKVAAGQASAITLLNFETNNVAITATSATTLAGLTLNATAASTINLTGSVDTTITAFATTTTNGATLNAADFGAKLTTTIGNIAATVVGGAGNDTIMGGTADDLIVGGAGNDTIVTGGADNATMSDTIVAGAGNDVITLGSSAATLSDLSATSGTAMLLINGGDGIDTLNLAADSVANVLTGKLTNLEFVNLSATSGGSVKWTTADSDLAAGNTLTLNWTGAATGASVVFNGAAETNGNFNINVSSVFTAAAAAEISSITTGAGNDTITLTASAGAGMASTLATVITGGKGVDTITLGASATAVISFAAGDSGITVATADVISGANAGDVLKFSSITVAQTSALATATQLGTGWSIEATSGLATKTNATLDDFITAAATSAKAGSTGMNGQLVGFVSGGDTYVFYAGTDTASNSDDGLIKLVGITADLISAGAAGSFVLG